MRELYLLVAVCCIILFAPNRTLFAQTIHTSCYVKGDSCYRVTWLDQCECAEKHPIYNIPQFGYARKVAQLGTQPQFGAFTNCTSVEEVYQQMQRTYLQNRNGNAAELDRLWRAMGYTGFRDSRFSPTQITQINYENGVIGMMGARGHTYIYASILPNSTADVKAYRVKAQNSDCDIAFLDACGNAFFAGCVRQSTTTICPLDLPASETRTGPTVTRIGYMRNDSCLVDVCDQDVLDPNHPAYRIPSASPHVVQTLGTHPQFGSLANYNTPKEVYFQLKALYQLDQNGNAAELDRLWKAMGYQFFNDPEFDETDVSVVDYANTERGMLGEGGHNYRYSVVMPKKGDTFRAYKIHAPANCDLAILEACGNIFFSGCEIENCITYPCGCN